MCPSNEIMLKRCPNPIAYMFKERLLTNFVPFSVFCTSLFKWNKRKICEKDTHLGNAYFKNKKKSKRL